MFAKILGCASSRFPATKISNENILSYKAFFSERCPPVRAIKHAKKYIYIHSMGCSTRKPDRLGGLQPHDQGH